jgi:hypothetical protein
LKYFEPEPLGKGPEAWTTFQFQLSVEPQRVGELNHRSAQDITGREIDARQGHREVEKREG